MTQHVDDFFLTGGVTSHGSTKGFTELTYEVRVNVDNTAFVNQLSAKAGVESAVLVEFTGDYFE